VVVFLLLDGGADLSSFGKRSWFGLQEAWWEKKGQRRRKMLVLFETPAGYSLLKVVDEGKLEAAGNLMAEFEKGAGNVVALEAFHKFDDTREALAAATALVEGSLDSSLQRFLKKNILKKEIHDELAVADKKLGGVIKEKLNINCVSDSRVMKLIRGVRSKMSEIIPGLEEGGLTAMALGLSHSLSRYKLQFSPDKVDTMIVQAINLLDELDKEINTYAMRVKEWYGWHFPEMAKIVTDNMQYAKVVLKAGMRKNMGEMDFSDILEDDVEKEMKVTCELSMGTEISQDDVKTLCALCSQVISLSEYRAQLYEYLKNRMAAIAPNLSVMVGDLVGARLIAHAGSLMNLAKAPASTVQILGAEKALFRALKTKHDTPKYGLIYHASLIGQTSAKNKGKISRVLAAKTSLAIRVDALGESSEATIGYACREKVEARLRQLESKPYTLESAQKQPEKYVKSSSNGAQYNTSTDTTLTLSEKKKAKKRKLEETAADESDSDSSSEEEEEIEGSAKANVKENGTAESSQSSSEDEDRKKKSKKEKKKKRKSSPVETIDVKKKKKRKTEESSSSSEDEKKKKKSKKKKEKKEKNKKNKKQKSE